MEAPTPEPGSLTTAEYLASFFAAWPVSRRPQLALDMDGFPTFAAKSNEFYLHLTVEQTNILTWYAIVSGAEYFQDGVAFDGTALPIELAHFAD